MLSSPSSSYFLFNTPLMVTPFLSYNWETKEKSNMKPGEYWQLLVMSRTAVTPSKASPSDPLGHADVIPKMCSPLNTSSCYARCAHL